MNEFELIGELTAMFDRAVPRPSSASLPVPNGDDAAVVRPSSGMVTLTTDSLVEEVHFSFRLGTPADAGFRSVAVNLSDLAAMGAIPVGLLVSLIIPREMADSDVLAVGRGIAEAASLFTVPVIGGNIAGTGGPFVISITAAGDQVCSPPPLRSRARPGDGIWVSGHPGDGAAGLRILKRYPDMAGMFCQPVQRFLRPIPRLDLVSCFVGTEVHAAIDVSDGLMADIGHVATASGVRAVVDCDRIPVSAAAREFCAAVGMTDLLDLVLSGGDDYELVMFAPASSSDFLVQAGMTLIGHVEAGHGVCAVCGGVEMNGPARSGWLHR